MKAILWSTLLLSTLAMAQDGGSSPTGWYALACAISIGLAALGGAIGQGTAVAAALEGIARNPGAAKQIFTPMIIGLVLIESLVIYALVISFILNGHIG